MEDDGGWPAPKKGDVLYNVPKGNGYVHYDKCTDIIMKLENTNPKFGERMYVCATSGCRVKVKTNNEDKVLEIVHPKKKNNEDPASDVHHHNNYADANEITMLKMVHQELWHGLEAYASDGVNKIISAIRKRCEGNADLFKLCPSPDKLKGRWWRALKKFVEVSFRRKGRIYL